MWQARSITYPTNNQDLVGWKVSLRYRATLLPQSAMHSSVLIIDRHVPVLCSGAVRIKSVDRLLLALARSPRIMTRMNRIARTIARCVPQCWISFKRTTTPVGSG
jgi:hypothetical protein